MSDGEDVGQFAWVLPGVGMRAGTLAAYARDMEQAHYSGNARPSVRVWDGSEVLRVTVRYIGKNVHDSLMYEVSCGWEAVVCVIDGRT